MHERGELLLVPFPFSDLSATKRWPVLALIGPDTYGNFIAMPVTSRPHHTNAMAISAAEITGGSLPVASWARTDRVVTLNSALVPKSIARVNDLVAMAAIGQLCEYLCCRRRIAPGTGRRRPNSPSSMPSSLRTTRP